MIILRLCLAITGMYAVYIIAAILNEQMLFYTHPASTGPTNTAPQNTNITIITPTCSKQ